MKPIKAKRENPPMNDFEKFRVAIEDLKREFGKALGLDRYMIVTTKLGRFNLGLGLGLL